MGVVEEERVVLQGNSRTPAVVRKGGRCGGCCGGHCDDGWGGDGGVVWFGVSGWRCGIVVVWWCSSDK